MNMDRALLWTLTILAGENSGSFHDLCIENFVGDAKLIKPHGSESYIYITRRKLRRNAKDKIIRDSEKITPTAAPAPGSERPSFTKFNPLSLVVISLFIDTKYLSK